MRARVCGYDLYAKVGCKDLGARREECMGMRGKKDKFSFRFLSWAMRKK